MIQLSRVEAAELRRYNANSRNHNTGDCVIRALSIAYGIRYDEVHRELLSIYSEYQYKFVWTQFINKYGYVSHGKPDTDPSTGEVIRHPITLDEFAEMYSGGTYIVSVGKRPNTSDHLVCVENGTIWDTWNSLNEYVKEYWLIRSAEDTLPDTKGFDDNLVHEYEAFITDYMSKLKKKAPYMDAYVSSSKLQDDYSLLLVIRCVPNHLYNEQFSEEIKFRQLNTNWTKTLRAVVKFNPKVDFDTNKSKTLEKLRVQVREWLYQIRKTIEAASAVHKANYNVNYHGDHEDRRLLIKMPAWAQPLLTKCVDHGELSRRYGQDRYTASMDALDDDPRKETAPVVNFRADTIPELRSNLEDYRTKFLRVDYDY